MLFSAKAEYACQAMVELAARHGDPRPIRLTEITDKYAISPKFLVTILIELKNANLVATTRGRSGGYCLARPPAEITLADVFDAVEGSETPTIPERVGGAGATGNPEADALREVWSELASAYADYLAVRRDILRRATLADLAEASQGLQYVI